MRELTTERGSALVIVGVAMSLLFGLAALVIDHGHNLSEYRRLTTATDAAALAAADAYAYGGTGCDSVARDYLLRNTNAAQLISCDPHGDTTAGTFGWVVVTAELTVDQFFAHTFGFDETIVESTSVAVFGAPQLTFSGGARPMSLCFPGLAANADYISWQAGGGTGESPPIRVGYNKDHPSDCGNTTGNWGFVDFDGGGASNADTRDWIENGYPGDVTIGWVEGDTGAISGSHSSALQSLVNSGETFWLPTATEVTGNGSNAQYYVANFIAVRLTGFKVTGSQHKRYLEIVIDPDALLPDTTCCAAPPGVDLGLRTTGLFQVDGDGNPIGVSP